MANFKEYLSFDLDTFFKEFAENHIINGDEIEIIIDNEILKERQAQKEIYEGDVLFYVRKTDFKEAPAIGQHIELDNNLYRVDSFNEEDGLYLITLGANM